MLFEQKLSEFNINDKKEAYICLNNSSVIYREIITPKIDEKKLTLIVRSEMMDALNLTPNYIMDYITLEEIVDEEGQESYRLLAVAILDSALETYLSLMKELKIKPVVIDTATNSIIKTMSNIPEVEKKDQVIVTEVGNGHLRLYLFDRGMYILSRNIKMISYDELTKAEYLSTIEDNISKMIQFSFTRGIKSGIEQIYLIGKDDLLEEIQHIVTTNLLVECSVMEQPEFVDGTCPFLTQYVNVLGTMLRK
jgi:Tfp pilus assembly PilM family ATPase